jgi:hypothetical protein
MRRTKLPPEVLEFFRKQGAKGGKLGGSIGGQKAAAGMTPDERVVRAKKASTAAAAARKAKKKNASVSAGASAGD